MQLLITGLSCIIIDKSGRRALLMTAGVGMSSALVVLGFYFYEKNHGGSPDGTVAIIAVVLYIAFFSLGLGAIPWLMMSEIFPLKTRSLAASAATMLNWTLSFAVTEAFPYLKEGITPEGTFWLFAGVCVIGVLFVLTSVIETKGKTLEEITEIFEGTRKDEASGEGKKLVMITTAIMLVVGLLLMLAVANVF